MSLDEPPLPSLEWAYFLDVDGTLIEIADAPDAVCIDAALLELIERLYRASGGAVALVSGRAISDLDHYLGRIRVPVAGQHGIERRDVTGRTWIHAEPSAAKRLIVEQLAPILVRHPGLLLEDKGLTLALHYRLAPHLATYVRRLMTRLAATAGSGFEVQLGKRVAEIKPSGIDKGSAIADFLTESPFRKRRAVFVGDDINDEHGFDEVNRRNGISIKVGIGASCARYRLPNVVAVRRWLGSVLKGEECKI